MTGSVRTLVSLENGIVGVVVVRREGQHFVADILDCETRLLITTGVPASSPEYAIEYALDLVPSTLYDISRCRAMA